MDVIQFGTTVIDETLKRTFTLTNRGALGTTFEFFKVTGMKSLKMICPIIVHHLS